MSYIIRNTIALGVILLFILSIGIYFGHLSLPEKIEKSEKEIKRIEIELQNTPDLINQFNLLTNRLEITKEKWETRNKDIPASNVTGEAYDYLNQIIIKSGEIKLDMLFAGNKSLANYGFNSYKLKGEAPYENIFRFIWYIENNRPLYKIKELKLRSVETKSKDKKENAVLVTFEMTIEAYYSTISELHSSVGEAVLMPPVLTVDPFYPLILRDLPPNTNDLVEIERADLKAVVQGKAFVVDQGNRMRTLAEGDEVYLGYVTKIDPVAGQIECTLNKGGIIEKFELFIRYGQKQK